MDVPREQALTLGILMYVMTFVASLIGLPMLAFGGRDRDEDPTEQDAHGGTDQDPAPT